MPAIEVRPHSKQIRKGKTGSKGGETIFEGQEKDGRKRKQGNRQSPNEYKK